MSKSYLVAAIGATKGALIQCFADSEAQANAAVEALFIDTYGEPAEVQVIDMGAPASVFIEGDPEYIRSVLARKDMGTDGPMCSD